MKRSVCFMFLLLYIGLATSCDSYRSSPPMGEMEVKVKVSDAGVFTKSAHLKSETEVKNMALALYCDGVLARSVYYTSLSELRLTDVVLGRTFMAYALANVGNVTFPAMESDVKEMTVKWLDIAGGDVWPMSWSGSILADKGCTLEINLVRLVARCDLTMDLSALSLYKFHLQEVRLRSGAGDCHPFVAGSCPSVKAVDPDGLGETDKSRLTQGKAASFYLFESCFGDLLPDNHDPWNKIPSSIPGDVSPPYFEIKGKLIVNDNSEASRNVTYRFYLGQNATRNFDVFRNTVNEITLQLDDSNVAKGSWKVEAGPISDNSSIKFSRQVLEVPYNSTGYVDIYSSPGNLKFLVYEKDGSMSGADLSYRVSGKRIHVTSLKEGPGTGVLYASTIDGRKECYCTVKTVEPPVRAKSISLRCTVHAGYNEDERVYYQTDDRFFCFEADVLYSDGTFVENVKDFTIFEWKIVDDEVVSTFYGNPEKLNCRHPGTTTVYVTCDGVMSNTINVCVYNGSLSVYANPGTISADKQSTLMAHYGGIDVSRFTDWTIVSGAEYGSIEQGLYTYAFFIPNRNNDRTVEIVIAGDYNGHHDECMITLQASNGSGGASISHRLVLTPGSAEIPYDGIAQFRAIYYTYTNGTADGGVDVTNMSSWSVDDYSVAKVLGQGGIKGSNRSQNSVSTTVAAMYAGFRASASLIVGPSSGTDPQPDPEPGTVPGTGPDSGEPKQTGISLILDRKQIFFGESIKLNVAAHYDDGSTADVTEKINSWPEIDGCAGNRGTYVHNKQGLSADASRTVTVYYGDFSASAEITLCRRYVSGVEVEFADSMSKKSGDAQKPGYSILYNDGIAVSGRPGDMDRFSVDGVRIYDGGSAVHAADYSTGPHTLTIYVYVCGRSGSLEQQSASKMFMITE